MHAVAEREVGSNRDKQFTPVSVNDNSLARDEECRKYPLVYAIYTLLNDGVRGSRLYFEVDDGFTERVDREIDFLISDMRNGDFDAIVRKARDISAAYLSLSNGVLSVAHSVKYAMSSLSSVLSECVSSYDQERRIIRRKEIFEKLSSILTVFPKAPAGFASITEALIDSVVLGENITNITSLVSLMLGMLGTVRFSVSVRQPLDSVYGNEVVFCPADIDIAKFSYGSYYSVCRVLVVLKEFIRSRGKDDEFMSHVYDLYDLDRSAVISSRNTLSNYYGSSVWQTYYSYDGSNNRFLLQAIADNTRVASDNSGKQGGNGNESMSDKSGVSVSGETETG